jgi:hypothetical protein
MNIDTQNKVTFLLNLKNQNSSSQFIPAIKITENIIKENKINEISIINDDNQYNLNNILNQDNVDTTLNKDNIDIVHLNNYYIYYVDYADYADYVDYYDYVN